MENQKYFESSIIKNFFDIYTELFVFFDKEGKILYHNNIFQYFFGMNEKDLIGKSFTQIFPINVVGWLAQNIQFVYNYWKPVSFTDKVKVGEDLIWLEIKLLPLLDEQKQITAVVCNIKDVTEKYEILVKAEQTADKYTALFSSINDSIFVHGFDSKDEIGKFVEVNSTACMKLGYTYDELLNLSIKDIESKDMSYKTSEVFNELKSVGYATYEGEHTTKYGKVFPVEINARVFKFNGEPFVISVARDVTERKLHETKLKESEERFRLLFDKMLDGFGLHEIILDQIGRPIDFKILEINKAFEQLFECKAEDVIGKRYLEVLPKAEPFWLVKFGKVALTGESVKFENFSKHFNRYFEVVCYSPKQNQFVTIFSDVTTRKLAELEMIKQSEKLDALLQNSSDIVSIIDEQGKLLFVSAAVEKIYGSSVKDLIGTSLYDNVHPSDINIVKEKMNSLLLFPFDTVVFQYRYRTNDGIFIWMESAASNQLNTPLIKGLIINSRDISKQKAEEEEKERLHGKLFHASKLATIGTLAAGIAHEINNPLFIAKGFLENIKKQISNKNLMDEEMESNFAKQINALTRIETIVQGLRTYARTDTDIVELVDVHKTINDTISLCEYIYKQSDIYIKCDLKAQSFIIKGNVGKIQQVIMNLLSNAKDAIIDARRNGGNILLKTYNENDNIVLKISDDGCGIDKNDLPNIFDPFFTTKSPGKGTGLGLSIIYAIIETFNGQITVDSEIGLGTSFTIVLPTAKERAQFEVKQQYETKMKFAGKALIVDDEEDVRIILRDYLKELGIESFEAVDGQEALDMLKEKYFDYVFTDIKMPKMSGDKLIMEAEKLSIKTSFIVISGGLLTDYSKEERDVIKYHAVGFLKKPFNYHSVHEVLETIGLSGIIR